VLILQEDSAWHSIQKISLLSFLLYFVRLLFLLGGGVPYTSRQVHVEPPAADKNKDSVTGKLLKLNRKCLVKYDIHETL
jgi:hypothetical protein